MRSSILLYASLVVLILVAVGCYEVEYTVEYKGDSCIKFEDAVYYVYDNDELVDVVDACLGDDEIEEADVFEVVLDSAVEEITVSLKAGGGKNSGKVNDVTVPTDGVTEVSVGSFTVKAGEIIDDGDEEVFTYQIGVGCDDDNKTAALSNITFCFGEATILSPEEGTITIERATDLDAPGEPVEEVEEVD